MKRATTTQLLVIGLLLLGGQQADAQLVPVGPLNVTTAVAGAQPAPVNATSSYAANLVFSGQMKVVASLNANMPLNTTLACQLTGPPVGTSLGFVNLDVTPRNLVIASTPNFYTNVTIRYIFTPSMAAGVVPLSTRRVTFTLLTYP